MTQQEDDLRQERGKALKSAMFNRGWNINELALKTGYDRKTIRKLLTGEYVRDQTAVDVSQALGVQQLKSHSVEIAAEEYGGYLRGAHRHYECEYAFYRRDFIDRNSIYKTVIKMFWDDKMKRISFNEFYIRKSTPDVQCFYGSVYISPRSNLLHMVTTEGGSVRLLTVTRLMEYDEFMRGIILTQSEAERSSYQPTVSSVVLQILQKSDENQDMRSKIYRFGPEAPEFESANRELAFAEQNIAKIALLAEAVHK